MASHYSNILNNAHQLTEACVTDFWRYTSTYREQPKVNFLNQLIVQIGGDDGRSINQSVWTTFPNFNALLQTEEIVTPLTRVSIL